MKIIEQETFGQPLKDSGFHVLTFAETGFAMLNLYAKEFGIEDKAIENFSVKVNNKNESGSLYPRAPISAVPRRYIRDDGSTEALAQQIAEFLQANHSRIKAKKLLFDFRAGVAPFVIKACRMALEGGLVAGVEEVVVINNQ